MWTVTKVSYIDGNQAAVEPFVFAYERTSDALKECELDFYSTLKSEEMESRLITWEVGTGRIVGIGRLDSDTHLVRIPYNYDEYIVTEVKAFERADKKKSSAQHS